MLMLTKSLLCPNCNANNTSTEEEKSRRQQCIKVVFAPVRLFELCVLLPLSCVVPPDKFYVLPTPENMSLPKKGPFEFSGTVLKLPAPIGHSQLDCVPRHVTSLKLWIRHPQPSWLAALCDSTLKLAHQLCHHCGRIVFACLIMTRLS